MIYNTLQEVLGYIHIDTLPDLFYIINVFPFMNYDYIRIDL